MSTMTMPGFTAESSVYRTSGYYQMTVGFAAHRNVIQPSQVTCDPGCIADCPSACDFDPRCTFFCERACCQPTVTCGPCVGSRGCSDGTQRACSV